MPSSTPIQIGHYPAFVPPSELARIWADESPGIRTRIYHPDNSAEPHLALELAFKALDHAAQAAPAGLVPLTFVDDRSLACVVCRPVDGQAPGREGSVVRWHLDDIPSRHQGALLDTDVQAFMRSIVEEASHHDAGLRGMASAAETYEKQFVAKQLVAKPEALRPFRLASQNVIVGLAAMRHDEVYDSHRVHFWQCCDVPHVATFEGCRALTVLTLCDAFQAGGTMEIDFSRHPEHCVPAVLRRYGRTLGLQLGAELKGRGISPAETRELFMAVTPMPNELRERVNRLADQGEVSVEALCYSLMSPIWRPIELDFILACSSRASSMLRGGAPLDDPGRMAEHEVGRAARMVGMLFDRLNTKDAAASAPDGEAPPAVRVFDDRRYGITWSVLPEFGAVRFRGLPAGRLPWQDKAASLSITLGEGSDVIVVPRANPIGDDLQTVRQLTTDHPGTEVVAVVPVGTWLPSAQRERVLVCPDPLRELDAAVVRNLLASKLARA